MKTIVVCEIYDAPAAALWAYVVRYDTLQAMMSGPFVRVQCPQGEEQVGHDVALTFRLFGFIPVGRWRFKVLARDDTERRLLSEESGTGVRFWRHEIKIAAEGAGARLTDTITIDAGVLTPLIVAFARRDYERRHRLRKAALTVPR
jgi:ligand-binding SRPBCC domain-containing protein